jgi:hypothetical protein
MLTLNFAIKILLLWWKKWEPKLPKGKVVIPQMATACCIKTRMEIS